MTGPLLVRDVFDVVTAAKADPAAPATAVQRQGFELLYTRAVLVRS